MTIRSDGLTRSHFVAIVSPDFPEPPGGVFALEHLMQPPLIFRPRGSSTQKVVDRMFCHAGLKPMPRLIADTRDAIYEAVGDRGGFHVAFWFISHRFHAQNPRSQHGRAS